MKPLVTIVTPSYNQGRFIRATIESVLSQDYERIEYIIMDSASTDETAKIVREYLGRLTWISEKDRGQSHAINRGFRMAQGEIVAWLNSDDIILPGAVSHAVRAFERRPALGAVYGEGYQIDADGNIKGRFPVTEPFNLWKLVYLSDYILQQTVYFRRSVFDEVGYLDESLHWGMDWDILIRIGKRYWIDYIPEYMGCLREHGEAKTATGGGKRFQELARILRRHGDLRYPPGYIIYGLETYRRLWDEWLMRRTPGFLKKPSQALRKFLLAAMGSIIGYAIREGQGWYSDGWATTKVHYMLPPGNGKLRLRGTLPGLGARIKRQKIRVRCNGTEQEVPLEIGDFDVTLTVPATAEPAKIVLLAASYVVPNTEGLGSDSRRLAYILKGLDWESQ
jgi:glycosyltransferase involved in cell wall biosynthesis